jgi:hypothetical protein
MNARIFEYREQVKAIDSKISPKPATPSSARNPIPPTEQVSSVGGKVVWVYIAAPYIFLSTARTVFYQSQQQDDKGLLLRASTGGSVVFFTRRRRQLFYGGISFVR